MLTTNRMVAGLSLSLLAGCNHVYQPYSAHPLSSLDLTTTYTTLQEKTKVLITDQKCYAPLSEADKASLTGPCTQQRNFAISALVMTSAEECLRYRRGLYGSEAAWNITLGTATSLFAGGAAIVTGAQAKSILGGLALFSNSERSLINETVYKQMLVTAVDKKIMEMRDTKMLAIHDAMKNDVNTYPVYEAFNDVIDLHSTCSFVDGLQKALQEGTQATSAQRITRLKQTLRYLQAERDVPTMTNSEDKARINSRIADVNKALAEEEIR
ncbi:hypothetical protein [Ralstonia pseudosolanacearum]|nr:hypothetical protein [Ralstonia pseudosolanacearum]MDO3549071.1 hypothetical protein [Ralstonia pseudosolanacearum]MDO3552074.1 hypothetical protein [Ralstonia pseudosolanacearum]MDO3567026.1 hypothetical protein [Ralstonia pseudosolanacearum]MDO3582434.1 hypothetical protein [Ralstonia pseudosolanacearum]MDO3592104.1 hypothetical protein [Ralstonia pseudosolanacearum]